MAAVNAPVEIRTAVPEDGEDLSTSQSTMTARKTGRPGFALSPDHGIITVGVDRPWSRTRIGSAG